MGILMTWIGLSWQAAAGHQSGLGPLTRMCVHLLAWGRDPAVLLLHAGPLAAAVAAVAAGLATSSGLALVAWAIGARGRESGCHHGHRVPLAHPPLAESCEDRRL
jgi:hypothetical protein